MLEVGQFAPLDIAVTTQNSETITLKDFLGQKQIVYFYPKDNTPGCTVEACEIRDNWKELNDLNVKVFGVSPDNAKSHQKFIADFTLPFNLLCDDEKLLAKAFGVWGEKSMFGKKYMGILRTSFIIDEKGVISCVFKNVKPKGHALELLNTVKKQ